MRRTIATTTAAFAVALLAGCGSSDQDAPEDGAESVSVMAAAAEHLTSEPGVEYAVSIQAWAPYLQLWRVDGDAVSYSEISCLGTDGDVTTGTWEGSRITWDGRSPIQGAGMGSTTSVELTEDTLHRVGARESAVSDIEGELTAHVEKCEAAGKTVGGILLG